MSYTGPTNRDAQRCYEHYAKAMGWIGPHGEGMPSWEHLPEKERFAWAVVAQPLQDVRNRLLHAVEVIDGPHQT